MSGGGGLGDNSIRVWNADGTCERTLLGHTGAVYALTVFKDKLASGSGAVQGTARAGPMTRQ